jgi:hypothetical protein
MAEDKPKKPKQRPMSATDRAMARIKKLNPNSFKSVKLRNK